MNYKILSKYYNLFFPIKERIKNEIPFFLEYCKKNKIKNILDFGCGTGIHAYHLAKSGYNVIGVDPSSGMLAQAKKTENLKYELNDINYFLENKIKFDLIFSIGNSPAYLETKKLKDFFIYAHKALEDNGSMILQMLNYDYIIKNKIKNLPVLEKDRKKFIRIYKYKKGYLEFYKIIIDGKKKYIEKDKIFPHTLKYLINNAAGFKVDKIYWDFDKSKFTSNKNSFILILKKV